MMYDKGKKIQINHFRGARDDTKVGKFASHQCGPGSNLSINAILCALSLLLVFFLACRGFSRCSGVPFFSKTNISKFQFEQEW